MKKSMQKFALFFLILLYTPGAAAAELLIPVGQVVGLELRDDSVTVAAYDDALGATVRNCGLKIGDEILQINGTDIDTAQDVRTALNTGTAPLEILVQRGGKRQTLQYGLQVSNAGFLGNPVMPAQGN